MEKGYETEKGRRSVKTSDPATMGNDARSCRTDA